MEGEVAELREEIALLELQRNLPRALPAEHREALRERGGERLLRARSARGDGGDRGVSLERRRRDRPVRRLGREHPVVHEHRRRAAVELRGGDEGDGGALEGVERVRRVRVHRERARVGDDEDAAVGGVPKHLGRRRRERGDRQRRVVHRVEEVRARGVVDEHEARAELVGEDRSDRRLVAVLGDDRAVLQVVVGQRAARRRVDEELGGERDARDVPRLAVGREHPRLLSLLFDRVEVEAPLREHGGDLAVELDPVDGAEVLLRGAAGGAR